MSLSTWQYYSMRKIIQNLLIDGHKEGGFFSQIQANMDFCLNEDDGNFVK